jgi:hypothetical protein
LFGILWQTAGIAAKEAKSSLMKRLASKMAAYTGAVTVDIAPMSTVTALMFNVTASIFDVIEAMSTVTASM